MSKATNTIYPVIMSGGSGTRLWPLSRKTTPKQYWALASEETMLEATLKRVMVGGKGITVAPPIIVCASGHADFIRDHARNSGIDVGDIILEPMGRNTAPVAAIAAAHVKAMDPDGLILLLPADHHVGDPEGFWQAAEYGIDAAENGFLVTLGIQPVGPETGYGYIQRGDDIGPDCYKVKRFVEKPDHETAESYLASGDYFWNAGIFLFKADALSSEMEKHAPEIMSASRQALHKASKENGAIFLDAATFDACPSDSIDYAVMEKTENAAIVAPVAIGWNDIGAWAAVHDIHGPQDTTTVGDVLTEDCSRSYIRSDGPLVAAIGVEDLIVIATKDAVLITRKDQSQQVKKIVTRLKDDKRDEML